MRFLFVVCFACFSFKTFALIRAHEFTRPDKAYMAYFFSAYIPWYEEQFKVAVFSHKKKDYIKKVFSEITHWHVPHEKKLNQVLFGFSLREGKPYFRFRLYVSPKLREQKEMFIEWDTKGHFCFISPLSRERGLDKVGVEVLENDILFEYSCDKGEKRYAIFSVKSKYFDLNPFAGLTEEEWRIYENKKVKEVYYYSAHTHLAKIDKAYYHYINAHGEKSLLPFDKFSVTDKNEVMIYYP